MPTSSNRWLVSGLAVALLAGCTENGGLYSASRDNFGDSYRQTMAAQIIDPAPQYDDSGPKANGEVTAAAVERYRTDKVKRPARVSTQQSLGGSGGSGGGGGGGG
ncbi:MAG: hypothetical protein KGL48_03780 [Sphingomonadales bacterium]|nr:hypothetical protein [Sphingomonadales bacterium]MDE2568019.1 hypothetical protein [Sphingomonadales bacterium]